MTSSTSHPCPGSSPVLYSHNGYRFDKIQTEAETKYQSSKQSLENTFQGYLNHLLQQLQQSQGSHPSPVSVVLDEGSLNVIVTINSPQPAPASGSTGPKTFSIPVSDLLGTSQPSSTDSRTQIETGIKQSLQTLIQKDSSIQTALEEWNSQATIQNQDQTNQKVKEIWKQTLEFLRTQHSPAPAQSTPNSPQPPSINLDESSVKINLSKKYITYTTSDQNGHTETHVICLIKNKALAEKLKIEDAIIEIEKKHQITVKNSLRFCDSASEIVKKGFFRDTHFLDKTSSKKSSFISAILKKIDAKIKDLQKASPTDNAKIKNLENFKKALERKTQENPNGIDYFAIELAIKHRKGSTDNVAKIEAEIEKVTKDFKGDNNDEAIKKYAHEVALLELSREEAIIQIEENTSSWHMLAPSASKESMLVQAMFHGLENIGELEELPPANGSPTAAVAPNYTYEHFKKLFGAEMTDEIKEILSTAAQSLEKQNVDFKDDVIIGAGNGSSSTPQRSRTSSKNPSEKSDDACDKSSNSGIHFGARAQTEEPDPTDLQGWNARAVATVEKRPNPILRSDKEDQELRASINNFIKTGIHQLDRVIPKEELGYLKISILKTLAKKLKTNADRLKAVKILQKAIEYLESKTANPVAADNIRKILKTLDKADPPLEHLELINKTISSTSRTKGLGQQIFQLVGSDPRSIPSDPQEDTSSSASSLVSTPRREE